MNPNGEQNMNKIIPIMIASLALYGCGGGGGDHTPDDGHNHGVGILTVSHFPGMGGSVEDNLERWRRQVVGGTQGETLSSEHDGLSFHTLDITGTYLDSSITGTSRELSGYQMLATVIESPGGPHFVKLVGPAHTLERWVDSYHRFLEEIRP